ncbi:HAD family hydrolase [Microbulbifer sp. ANSA002]|uniref:HAD family hydrolase n=1 Tax=unclassified Microbulbifer TaxID=2619833 RepID=UPI0040419FA6
MNFDISAYETLVFDCDGVVLHSNSVKTQAFYQAVLPYGKAAAESMVDYHLANGGVSRYKKFAYFFEYILPELALRCSGPGLDVLLKTYAEEVRQGLLSCDIVSGLAQLRKKTINARWLIVSGGDQEELRNVFSQRGLEGLFDGGIFGSPHTKDEILSRELANGNILKPALFLGDSKYDYQAASGAGLDFVFLSGWSEVADWQRWVMHNKINVREAINDFVRI